MLVTFTEFHCFSMPKVQFPHVIHFPGLTDILISKLKLNSPSKGPNLKGRLYKCLGLIFQDGKKLQTDTRNYPILS